MTDSLREIAVGHGPEWQVVRLRPDDKRPADEQWPSLATNDPAAIRKRWNGKPYNIGGLLGNRFVIEQERDCEPEVAERFWKAYPGGKPKTRAHRSAGGSVHVIQEQPNQLPSDWPKVADHEYALRGYPGIKVKVGSRGQVVLPGSAINGVVYEAINSLPFRTATRLELDFVVALLVREGEGGDSGPSVSAEQRYTEQRPCPVCGGWSGLPQGESKRCWGFFASNGGRALCKRSERNPKGAEEFWHRLGPGCECGHFHGDPLQPFANWQPLARQEGPACPTLPASFWKARPALRHIHRAARAALVAPDALFGAVLARFDCLVSYRVYLPGLVGGKNTSLNIQIVGVGYPGAGKGGSLNAAEQLLPGTVEIRPAGSGEGFAAAFFEQEKQGQKMVYVQKRTAVLIRVDEGSILDRLGQRSGQTTGETLRQAWSGEAIGGGYVGPNKSFRLQAGSYRLAVMVAIQPELAGSLLAEEALATGTAQRLLWFSQADPDAPDGIPSWPGALAVGPVTVGDGPDRVLGLAESVRKQIVAERLTDLRHGGATDPHLAHRNLSRLKVAALLALLESRWEVSEEDWQLAGRVIDCSEKVVEWVEERLREAGAARARVASLAAGAKAATVKESEEATPRVARVLFQKVKDSEGGRWTKRDFTLGVASRDRRAGLLEPAIDHGTNKGWWIEDRVGGWVLGPTPPEND